MHGSAPPLAESSVAVVQSREAELRPPGVSSLVGIMLHGLARFVNWARKLLQ